MPNSSRHFGQFQSFGEMGWESRRRGYLSEQALVTALALLLRPQLRRSLKAIDVLHPDLATTVAAVTLADWR